MSETLFEKYGGEDTITALVDAFYERILSTESLVPFFTGIDMTRQKRHMTKFLAMVLGGPKQYTGRQMDKAHAGLKITSETFDTVAGVLQATLEGGGVTADDVGTIMGIAASTKEAIVTA